MNEDDYVLVTDLVKLRFIMHALGQLQPPLSSKLVDVARTVGDEIQWRELKMASDLDDDS